MSAAGRITKSSRRGCCGSRISSGFAFQTFSSSSGKRLAIVNPPWRLRFFSLQPGLCAAMVAACWFAGTRPSSSEKKCIPGANLSVYEPSAALTACPVGISVPMPQWAEISTPSSGRPSPSVTVPNAIHGHRRSISSAENGWPFIGKSTTCSLPAVTLSSIGPSASPYSSSSGW